MLGDAAYGTIVTESGEVCDLYTGECYDPESIARFAEPDYYRNKIREFQQTLDSLSQTASQMQQLAAIDSPERDLIESWLADYESKRWQFVTTAEAVNAAAEAANAAGLRMPVLSIPQGLAAAPLLVAGVAGAVAVAAGLIAWATERIAQAREIASRMAMIEDLPEDQRAAALAAEQKIALAQATSSPITQIADIVKWVALGVAAFFAFRAWREQ
jgi:hypothetical protein